MYGNILNNTQITALCALGEMRIDPFVKTKLKLAHYPLTVGSVLWVGDIATSGTRKFEMKKDFRNGEDYLFAPNEYAVIEINEFIKLEGGLVGHFVPSSILIEQGFGITIGKIDAGYGAIGGKRQQIRFGLKNFRDGGNKLIANQIVAHVYFVDLRGLNNIDPTLTKAEIRFLMDRYPRLVRAQDDGVDYGDGSG